MTDDLFERAAAEMARPEDLRLFEAATSGLPRRDVTEPYHSGAHSIRSLDAALRFLPIPRSSARVLEIGFNLGHSAALFLALGTARVFSVEIREDRKTRDAARLLCGLYPGRFSILFRDARSVTGEDLRRRLHALEGPARFDLAFIDGAHDRENAAGDIRLARSAGCQWFLLDDWYPHWGPGVRPAAMDEGLVPFAIVGGMALCVPRTSMLEPQKGNTDERDFEASAADGAVLQR